MFDELEEGSGFDVGSVNKQEQRNQGGSNNSGGGYNNDRGQNQGQQGGYRPNNGGGGGGGGGGFRGRQQEDTVQDPYLPVVVYVEQDFPEEVKNQLSTIASKLIGKGFTVRVYGTDKPFVEKIQKLSGSKVELYLPWRNFNELESKRTWNSLTAKHVAQQNFAGWEKVPDAVKGILAGQVRLLLGERNNSPANCLITWSADGASKAGEVSKETGRAGFIIKLAATFAFPVINMQKSSSEAIIEKNFGL